jgi:hypothetical protein
MITISNTNTQRPLEPVIGRTKPTGLLFRCSSSDRLLDCPGSYHVEAQCENNTNEAAESGTTCHRALSLIINEATMSNPDLLIESQEAQCMAHNLDPREQWIVRWFSDEIANLCQSHGGVKKIYKELPVSLEVISGEIKGHYDLLIECMDGTWHLVDYKTGRLSVSTADKTLQGQAYSLMICRKYNLQCITMHIIAAGNEADKTHTSCTYYHRHLEAIYATLLDITERAADPMAARIPGASACHYCKGLGTDLCPESRIYLERASKRLSIMLEDTEAMFRDHGIEEVDKIISMTMLCERVAKKIKPVIKAYIKQDENRSAEWCLGKPKRRRLWKDGEPPLDKVSKKRILTKKKLKELGEAKLTVGDIENAVYAVEKVKCDKKGERPRKKLDVLHECQDALKDSIIEKTDDAPLSRRK